MMFFVFNIISTRFNSPSVYTLLKKIVIDREKKRYSSQLDKNFQQAFLLLII